MTNSSDNEPTVVASPGAGAAARPPPAGGHADALPAGTRLSEFEIVSVIGQGGFGIVYLAYDLALHRQVAIKEYMPSALATRTRAMTVSLRSIRHAETFAAGLRSFVNEARLLARFDHPSLLKVYRFWEDHDTAYMVMPYYEGITLGKLLSQLDGPPDEAWLKALVHPLLDALELLHAAHCLHRDIAPDNILMLPAGRPLLLDFGAARRVIGGTNHALTVILKTGYAPVEQYGELPDMSQGPWTDLYALGSVVHFAITGRTPPQALSRLFADKYQPLAVTAAGRYSDGFLRAIDRSLAVLPKDRPQSVAEMRAWTVQGGAGAAADAPAVVSAGTMLFSPPTAEAASVGRDVRTPLSPSLRPAADIAKVDAGTGQVRPRRRIAATGLAILLASATAAGGYAWLAVRRDDVSAAGVPASLPPGPETAPGTAELTPAPAPAPAVALGAGDPRPEEAPRSRAPELPAADSPSPAPVVEPSSGQMPTAPSGDATVPRRTRPVLPPALLPGNAVAPSPPAPLSGAARWRPPQLDARREELRNERCTEMIQRASLGEELSDAEKSLLKQECRP